MFNSKNDPLVDSVKKIIQENDVRHRVETELNEHLGIASRKALPHELQAEYDSVLEEAIKEALNEGVEGSIPKTPEERKLAAKYGNPKRITHGDVLTGRGVIEEAPIYNVIHPEHGVIGTHSYDRGFVPSKPSLGFKAGKTIPDGAKIDRQNMIKSKTKNNMMKEETQLDEAGRTLMPGAKPRRSGSFVVAVNKAEASRLRALKRAAGMVNKGFSHETAAKEHNVTVAELKKHMMKKEAEQTNEDYSGLRRHKFKGKTTYMTGPGTYDDKEETPLTHSQARKMNRTMKSAPDKVKAKLWKKFWGTGQMEEEAEQLDEVGDSKEGREVLRKYAQKALRRGDMARRMSNNGQNADMEKYANKRQDGVKRAIDRLAKEEKEYSVDTERDIADNEREYGVDTEREIAKKKYPKKAKAMEESKRPSVPSDNIKKGAKAGLENAGGKTPAWLKKAIKDKKNLKEEQPYGDEEHHFYVDEKGRYELADKKPRHPEKSRFTTMAKAEARNRRIDSGDSGVKAELNEKAVSKAQHRLMGAAYAAKKSGEAVSPEVAKVARSMTMKQLKDYAKTKEKGLPEKVGK